MASAPASKPSPSISAETSRRRSLRTSRPPAWTLPALPTPQVPAWACTVAASRARTEIVPPAFSVATPVCESMRVRVSVRLRLTAARPAAATARPRTSPLPVSASAPAIARNTREDRASAASAPPASSREPWTVTVVSRPARVSAGSPPPRRDRAIVATFASRQPTRLIASTGSWSPPSGATEPAGVRAERLAASRAARLMPCVLSTDDRSRSTVVEPFSAFQARNAPRSMSKGRRKPRKLSLIGPTLPSLISASSVCVASAQARTSAARRLALPTSTVTEALTWLPARLSGMADWPYQFSSAEPE